MMCAVIAFYLVIVTLICLRLTFFFALSLGDQKYREIYIHSGSQLKWYNR